MTEPERRLAAVITAHPAEAARLIIRMKALLDLDPAAVERELRAFERVTGHNIDDSGVV